MIVKCSNCLEKIEHKFDEEYSSNCSLREKIICKKCNNEYYIYIKIRLHKGKTPAPYAKATKKAAVKKVKKDTIRRINK